MIDWLNRLSGRYRISLAFWFVNALIVAALIVFALRV